MINAIHNAVLNLLFDFGTAGSGLHWHAIFHLVTFDCCYIIVIENYEPTPRSSDIMHAIQHYLIKEMADKTQLSTDTIRFYEKKQLIQPSFRADNNYRYYDDEALKRLIFIKRCRALDMSLQEISQLLTLTQQPTQGCQVVDQLIEQHIQQVEHKIAELQSFQQQLHELRQSCSSTTTIDQCPILKQLESTQ